VVAYALSENKRPEYPRLLRVQIHRRFCVRVVDKLLQKAIE
jgi:hypothetical protein